MSSLPPSASRSNAALVIAHPGHEVRIYGWLERAHPRVSVLTDGSGLTGHSRLSSTTKILAQAGAMPSRLYGRFTDVAIYAAIIRHDFELFTGLAQELAETFGRDPIDYVVGDAAEGHNPAHDICRLLIDAAVEIANRTFSRRIANFDFLLVGQPDECAEELSDQAIWLELDEATFTRKLAVARDYVALRDEVNAAFKRTPVEAFRVECLRPVTGNDVSPGPAEEPPFYERYGEQQVAAGRYNCVLRYREHVLPLAEALRRYVLKGDR